jgi:hypothetical protein
MNPAETRIFQRVVKTNDLTRGTADQIVLEATLDHLDIARHRHAGEVPTELRPLQNTALLERAKLADTQAIDIPADQIPDAPHLAHNPLRVRLGAGSSYGEAFKSLKVRVSFHGLLDPEAGYIENTSIEFFELDLRQRKTTLEMERLRLVGASNFPTSSWYEQPLAWFVDGGILRNPQKPDDHSYRGEINAGVGYASPLWGSRLIAYVMAAGDTRAGQDRTDAPFDLGPQLGLIGSTRRWKSHTALAYLAEPREHLATFVRLQHSMRFTISRQWSLFADYHGETADAQHSRRDEIEASIGYFF